MCASQFHMSVTPMIYAFSCVKGELIWVFICFPVCPTVITCLNVCCLVDRVFKMVLLMVNLMGRKTMRRRKTNMMRTMILLKVIG